MDKAIKAARVNVMAALPTALLIGQRGGLVRWEQMAATSGSG